MTDREAELREMLNNADDQTLVETAVALVDEFLIARGDLEAIEMTLLRVLGRQGSTAGLSIHLKLGELYIQMGEPSRAKRFLTIATSSRDELTRQRSDELLRSFDK